MRTPMLAAAVIASALTLSGCSNQGAETVESAVSDGDQKACALIVGSGTPEPTNPEVAAALLDEAATLADSDRLVTALRDASKQAAEEHATAADNTIKAALTFCEGIGLADAFSSPAISVRNLAEEKAQAEEEARLATEEAEKAEQEAAAKAEQEAAEKAAADAAKAEADRLSAMTMGQKNAIKSARSYLNYTAFSRTGLIEQLEFEGYSTEDATFAVDEVAPDWNEQAAKSAQAYLDYTAFSRDGLIEQLMFEGFSYEQAEYGVTAVGY